MNHSISGWSARKAKQPCLLLLLLISVTFLPVQLAANTSAEIPEYLVQDGLVDKGTYNGYRRYHGTCHACHGQDGLGSSFAPALTESLKSLEYSAFVEVVTSGREATNPTGSVSAMPPFAEDPNVMKHLDDIYRYVKARADGALPPGRPKKLPKK